MMNCKFIVSCKIEIPVQFDIEKEQNNEVLEQIAEDIALGQLPINAKYEILNIQRKK